MLLTAGKFEQIMTSLRSDKAGSREKRRSPRVGLRMQIRIVPQSGTGQPQGQLVWLRDLSSGGVGFTHPSPIAPGTVFIACLPRGKSSTLKILYRVVRCNRVDDSQYVVGALLDRVLEDAVSTGVGGAGSQPRPAAS